MAAVVVVVVVVCNRCGGGGRIGNGVQVEVEVGERVGSGWSGRLVMTAVRNVVNPHAARALHPDPAAQPLPP